MAAVGRMVELGMRPPIDFGGYGSLVTIARNAYMQT
jgi:hypothetical protein